MSTENIRSSMEKTISFLKANPEKAFNKVTAATAVLEKGLKVSTTGPKRNPAVNSLEATR
jgi:hypothetical protein